MNLFSFNFPLREYIFCTSPASPPPPPHKFSNGPSLMCRHSQLPTSVSQVNLGSSFTGLLWRIRRENEPTKEKRREPVHRRFILFSFFSKTSANSQAKRAREKENFFFPHHYPLVLAVNKTPAVYILSPALDGLWRENRGSVNRLE